MIARIFLTAIIVSIFVYAFAPLVFETILRYASMIAAVALIPVVIAMLWKMLPRRHNIHHYHHDK